jgi:hypothetical protein
LVESHTLEDFPSVSAHIDILAALPETVGFLDDCYLEAAFGQPPGGGVTGNARASDQDMLLIAYRLSHLRELFVRLNHAYIFWFGTKRTSC